MERPELTKIDGAELLPSFGLDPKNLMDLMNGVMDQVNTMLSNGYLDIGKILRNINSNHGLSHDEFVFVVFYSGRAVQCIEEDMKRDGKKLPPGRLAVN